MGISKPTAEQIQAALIGGDIITPAGATVMIEGRVAASGVGPG